MKIIAGLGNPEQKYDNTYHNLGFMAVEVAADICGATFSKEKCHALIAETNINGEKVLFVKPLTYMNLSGVSLREILSFYKVDGSNLIVMCDDYDLPSGDIRIRTAGSGGTHNGLKNIVSELGTENFPRIRIGFKPKEKIYVPLIELVLSKISDEKKEIFSKAVKKAGEAGAEFAKGTDVQKIMQKYNGSVI